MATGVVRVITVASLISQAQAVREKLEENGDEEDESLKALMVMVSVLSIVLFKLMEMMCERKVAPKMRALRGLWADRKNGSLQEAQGLRRRDHDDRDLLPWRPLRWSRLGVGEDQMGLE